MTRYDICVGDSMGGTFLAIDEDEHGEWVRYEDTEQDKAVIGAAFEWYLVDCNDHDGEEQAHLALERAIEAHPGYREEMDDPE